MTYTVTKDFKDWDGFNIKEGDVADDCVAKGVQSASGKRWWNLIKEGRVMAVHLGYPPVTPTT